MESTKLCELIGEAGKEKAILILPTSTYELTETLKVDKLIVVAQSHLAEATALGTL